MKRYQWLIPMVLALCSALTSAWVGYNQNAKGLAVDLAVVQSRVETDKADETKRLDRIEDKLDRLIESVGQIKRGR